MDGLLELAEEEDDGFEGLGGHCCSEDDRYSVGDS